MTQGIMMFENFKIEYFQSHQDTGIFLHSGVNVFIGSSDRGKTSILRALKWLMENRPSGIAFRSWFANKTDKVKVSLRTIEGHQIIHERGIGGGKYILDGGEPFEAYGVGVPDEIKDVLNIGEFNVQEQFSRYFLLQDSPGEVARTLNRIVNLDEIDEALKKVNSLFNQGKIAIDQCGVSIGELEQQKEQFKDLPAIEILITRLDENIIKVNKLKDDSIELSESLIQLGIVQDKLAIITSWLEVQGSYDRLAEKVSKFNSKTTSHSTLDDTISGMVKTREAVFEIDEFLKSESLLKPLEVKIEEHRLLESKFKELDYELSHLELIKGQKEIVQNKHDALCQQYADMVEDLGMCPLCFSDDVDVIQILENL
jgi:DNA repair exonuclease SbcCD ATPase subunit